MIIRSQSNQDLFYREFLMSRGSFNPRDFGVDSEREDFIDLMADTFNETFRGTLTVDELLLRPRQALAFCDDVRRKFGFYDLPDDIILRSIMIRRKNPNR